MAPATAVTEEDLFEGKPLPTDTELVLGEDMYGDEPDENDSRPRPQGDPISLAVGSPGHMVNHMVHECYETFESGATTEPEEFDRYYFPPQEDGYDGPAPVLIDILAGDTQEDLIQERIDKHVEFKTRWCAERGIRYVVLADLEDLMLSPEALEAKIRGDEGSPRPARKARQAPQEAAKPARKRGIQRPKEA